METSAGVESSTGGSAGVESSTRGSAGVETAVAMETSAGVESSTGAECSAVAMETSAGVEFSTGGSAGVESAGVETTIAMETSAGVHCSVSEKSSVAAELVSSCLLEHVENSVRETVWLLLVGAEQTPTSSLGFVQADSRILVRTTLGLSSRVGHFSKYFLMERRRRLDCRVGGEGGGVGPAPQCL